MHCRPAAAGRVATRKKTENQRKKKTRKRRKINASGSRSGGIPLRAATDMVATPHCGARFLSVEKGFDEISRTAGHRILSPRPYRPHVRIPAIDIQKSGLPVKGIRIFVSKWRDSNPRPFGPEPNALPNCATPRMEPKRGLEPLTCGLRNRCSTD